MGPDSPDLSRTVYGTCECDWGTDIAGGNIPVDCKYRLYVAKSDGSDARLMASADDGDSLLLGGLSWSPDGTALAVSLNGDIWVFDSDGYWRANVTKTSRLEREPQWLADEAPAPSEE